MECGIDLVTSKQGLAAQNGARRRDDAGCHELLGGLRKTNVLRKAWLVLCLLSVLTALLDYHFGFLARLHGTEAYAHNHPLMLICLVIELMATVSQRPLRRAVRLEVVGWYSGCLVTLAALLHSGFVNDLFQMRFSVSRDGTLRSV